MAEYAYMSEVDPEFAPYLPMFENLPPVFDVELRRKRFREVFTEAGAKTYGPRVPADGTYVVANHEIEVEPGIFIRARSVAPKNHDDPDKTYPLMVWMHGGGIVSLVLGLFVCVLTIHSAGWVSGDLETDDLALRAISHDVQIAVLNVEYRSSGDIPRKSIKWAATNAKLLNADLRKGFLLGGLSAGAHLTAVLSHSVRDDPFFKDYSS
uniref:Alpha/beta hydrolase fold-3 domain-containing protein n=1 Tax=Mycena chlorophos TaxID=658473 RepID=A0ABQ0M638_MYCCL|nr:predicted protein [Mycena chlorophos]